MSYTAADFADLRGLSLRQPYADLVVLGDKRVETRGRDIGAQPGQVVAIHASLRPFSGDECPEAWRIRCARAMDAVRSGDDPELRPLGAIVGVARVSSVWTSGTHFHPEPRPKRCGSDSREDTWVRSRPISEAAVGDWSPGRSLIVLADVVRLAMPVPCRGMLGLWRVPEAARDSVVAQVRT